MVSYFPTAERFSNIVFPCFLFPEKKNDNLLHAYFSIYIKQLSITPLAKLELAVLDEMHRTQHNMLL